MDCLACAMQTRIPGVANRHSKGFNSGDPRRLLSTADFNRRIAWKMIYFLFALPSSSVN